MDVSVVDVYWNISESSGINVFMNGMYYVSYVWEGIEKQTTHINL